MSVTDCPLHVRIHFLASIDNYMPFFANEVAEAQPVPRIGPVRATRSPPTAFSDLTHVTCIPKEIRPLRNPISSKTRFFSISAFFHHSELRSHFHFLWSPSSGKLSLTHAWLLGPDSKWRTSESSSQRIFL
ncbi:hypothetical protein AVEN_260169-1 [Araneus ventricosus]|uniref:Uncharacterized protein n=1 Tax=Araneus ventricosus TaxID=182803 RepID=A0A4Y2DNR5_ARAVE|nr:hypothetical protein AVEN_260169-1 [Araneus ventricosus]